MNKSLYIKSIANTFNDEAMDYLESYDGMSTSWAYEESLQLFRREFIHDILEELEDITAEKINFLCSVYPAEREYDYDS